MMFWTREIVGWLLVVLGLIVFGLCYFELLRKGRIFEAGPTLLMGIFLFRGGLHLVKVAVAARLATQSFAPRESTAGSTATLGVDPATGKRPIARRGSAAAGSP